MMVLRNTLVLYHVVHLVHVLYKCIILSVQYTCIVDSTAVLGIYLRWTGVLSPLLFWHSADTGSLSFTHGEVTSSNYRTQKCSLRIETDSCLVFMWPS